MSGKLLVDESELIGTVSQTKRRGSLSSQRWDTGQRPLSSVAPNCFLKDREHMYTYSVTRRETSAQQHKITAKQRQLPFAFLWFWNATGWSANEEVEVHHSVHLNVIKVDFVIRPSINLEEYSRHCI